jgi:cation:H+ antiporter
MLYFLLIIGIVAITIGANFLVNGASSLGKKLGMTDIVIGLTIVAFGTSAPELIVNIFAGAKGNTDLAIANVLGSNIMNILIVIGIAAMIYPIKVSKNTLKKDIPFNLAAVVILWFMVNDTLLFPNHYSSNTINFWEGFILLVLLIVFLYYSYSTTMKGRKARKALMAKNIKPELDPLIAEVPKKKYPLYKDIILIVIGLTALYFGGNWTVESAETIALNFGISNTIIGLTVVAVGTSLPELATSIIAGIKKNPDLALGNAIGSCVFNIFLILGVTSLITPLPFDKALNFDVLITALSSIFLFVFIFMGKGRKISRFQGAFLVLIYFVYIIYSVSNHLS